MDPLALILSGTFLLIAILGYEVVRLRRRIATSGRGGNDGRSSAYPAEKDSKQEDSRPEEEIRGPEKVDAASSRLMAGISYQLRTPLTLTINPLEEILDGKYGDVDPGIAEHLSTALRNARRLLLLAGQLLDLSKLELGQVVVHAEKTDLKALLEDLAIGFAPWTERTKVTFQLTTPDSDVTAYLDPELIEKALVNIVTGAFKMTPPGGTVRMSLQPTKWARIDGEEGAFAVVSVRDSSPGIPQEELDQVFDKYYQVSTGPPTEHRAGLQLALARDLIRLQGGRIQIDSELGFGTEVSLFLPAGEAAITRSSRTMRSATRIAPGATPGSGDSGPLEPRHEALESETTDLATVLIIEDNADVRALLRRILEPGLRVVEASDGAEGLALARQLYPDVVVSDVLMPGLDGYQVCQRIKSDPDLSFIPVVLLTAKADREDRIEGLKEGADDYIVKPFDHKELNVRVHNLIAQRKRIKARLSNQLALHASDIEVISSDEAFITSVRNAVETHLDDEDFSVEDLASAVGLSRGHLHRRLKALLGITPSNAIKKIRLERAKQLLGGQAGTVSEIAYLVGFRSVSHFCKCFKEEYGVTAADAASLPSETN